jgi:hypothetical protein
MHFGDFAVVAAFAPAAMIFRLLRKISWDRLSQDQSSDFLNGERHSYRPLERLLDPSEFEFLRKRGMSGKKLRRFRAQRRKLFRLYLRQVEHDFLMAERLLCALQALGADSPLLARELAKQWLVLFRNLLMAELRLALHAIGFHTGPGAALLRPLEMLQAEVRMLEKSGG